MTNATPNTKPRIVLGPLATELMLNEAGAEEANREHLETAIQRLQKQKQDTHMAMLELQQSLQGPAPALHPDHTEILFRIHLILLELRKICVAGFADLRGDANTVVLEMEKSATQTQREIVKRLGLDLERFDQDNADYNRQIQDIIHLARQRTLETEEKER